MQLGTVKDYIDQRLVHEIHTSERKSFRGCRRRWNWLFNEFYYPTTTAKPLEFGIAFHNAMEVLYEPDTWSWDRQVVLTSAIKKFVDTCEEQRHKYLSTIGSPDMAPEINEDYNERVALGKGMLRYYGSEIMPRVDQGWRPLRVEQEFMVEITNPDTGEMLWCKCHRCWHLWQTYREEHKSWDDPLSLPKEDLRAQHSDYRNKYWEGLPVVLAGRLDMLSEDTFGNYWIVDWKTAARLSTDNNSFLALDDQIGSYVMALRRKLNLNVVGFIYVEMRKGFPEPPKKNKTVRLGCSYSVSKSQTTDYETFKATVMKNDAKAFNAGYYDDFLDWLQIEGPRFHERFQVVKTDAELYEIEKNLFLEASEMTDPNLRIYPSSGRFSCGFCAFRQPCEEKNAQGDYQFLLEESGLYERRKKHYWVKELSTDSQGGE